MGTMPKKFSREVLSVNLQPDCKQGFVGKLFITFTSDVISARLLRPLI